MLRQHACVLQLPRRLWKASGQSDNTTLATFQMEMGKEALGTQSQCWKQALFPEVPGCYPWVERKL